MSNDELTTTAGDENEARKVVAVAAICALMASGNAFTVSELAGLTDVRVYHQGRPANKWGELVGIDAHRLVDREIQRWRRKGLISFSRSGRGTVWSLTEAGMDYATTPAGPA